MITRPARIFLPLTGLGVVAAIIYSSLTGDHAGTTLFVALAAAALAAVFAVSVQRDNEFVAVGEAGAEVEAGPPPLHPLPPTRLPGGPGWPIMAALGTGFAVLALIAGPGFAIPGAALATIAAAGWLASISSDRTRRTPDLMPFGIPVVGLFAIGALMFFMSRILLAVPEQASTFIALTVAAVILAVASFIALKPSIPPQALLAALIIGALLMTGGGIVAGLAGEREVEPHHHGPEAIDIVARDIEFNREELSLHAQQEAVIDFRNADAVPHNVSIYREADFSGLAVFQGAVITGPESIEYRFQAPPAGTYYFKCDIHPSMQGRVLVA